MMVYVLIAIVVSLVVDYWQFGTIIILIIMIQLSSLVGILILVLFDNYPFSFSLVGFKTKVLVYLMSPCCIIPLAF
jgi:hypothetical protein